jgi:penicillin-binding protein 1C
MGKMKKKRKKILLFVFFMLLGFLTARFLPYPELEAFQRRGYSTVLESADGVVLRVFPAPDGKKREWTDLDAVPATARNVFIKAEDRRFFFHIGVDLPAITACAIRNAKAGRVVSGASTITMQLARLIKPHRAGLAGKIGEAFDAIRLEARLSKNAILELWLNAIPFGGNIEGLSAFSRARFGIPASALNTAQSAVLAVAPRRPALYDPAFHPEAALKAAENLSAQRRLGAGAEELRALVKEASSTEDQKKSPFLAPHFTERVFALADKEERRPIRTTLDSRLQAYAEERLRAELAGLARNRVSNGAVLLMENETGAVRCYIGSASWFDERNSGKIDGVTVKNQPGSCLKPFLYALAIDAGFAPNTILPDIPSVFGASEAYIPANFNRRFNGPVRLRVALASSLNIPAVWTLEQLGVKRFEDSLASLGFDSIAEKSGSYGTGLALGNAEVRLEELVRAFSVFQRNGFLTELRFFEEKQAEKSAEKEKFSPYAAFIIRDILSDKASRFTGFGTAPVLDTRFSALFKTGTANQYQNIWALGASGRWTAGVWMGNFSGETVVGKTGSSIPARIAADLLTVLEAAEEEKNDEKKDAGALAGAEQVAICSLSGMGASPFCTGTLSEWARKGSGLAPCDWHRADGVFYPGEYRSWLGERLRIGGAADGEGKIRLPHSGAVFYRDPSLPENAQVLRVETTGFGEGLVFIDGELQGALNNAGVFIFRLSPALPKGKHRVSVENEDNAASVEFEIR